MHVALGPAQGWTRWGSGLRRREVPAVRPQQSVRTHSQLLSTQVSRRTWEAERGSFPFPRTGAPTGVWSPPLALPSQRPLLCSPIRPQGVRIWRGGEEDRRQQPCPSLGGFALTEPPHKGACMASRSWHAARAALLPGEPWLQGRKKRTLLTGGRGGCCGCVPASACEQV